MKKTILYLIWAGLYLLCGLLGLIPAPTGALAVVMTLLSLGFFVPPTLLLLQARQQQDPKTVKTLRLLSAISLSATVVLLIVNILSMLASQTVGVALHVLLNFLSVPMFCCGSYALSLFLWACLLFVTFLRDFRGQKPQKPAK